MNYPLNLKQNWDLRAMIFSMVKKILFSNVFCFVNNFSRYNSEVKCCVCIQPSHHLWLNIPSIVENTTLFGADLMAYDV